MSARVHPSPEFFVRGAAWWLYVALARRAAQRAKEAGARFLAGRPAIGGYGDQRTAAATDAQ